jgi:hypothetical protein
MQLAAMPALSSICLGVWDGNFSDAGLMHASETMPGCVILAKGRGEFSAGVFAGTWPSDDA